MMKVFVTGASGYIGGSICHRLVELGHEVTGLVRTPDQASLLQGRGIETVLGSLDDADLLERAALAADAVINAANSDHFFSIRTFVTALAGTGKTLIHTSGSSIVCDDAMGSEPSSVVYEDDTPFTPMLHRTPRVEIDRMVRTAGVTQGVRAVVICPTMVYGEGYGLKTESDQLPKIVAKSRVLGAGVYIGTGKTIWSNVFISDLVDLYVLALERAPSGAFFFAENGETTFESIATSVSRSLGYEGKTVSWDVKAAIAELGGFARIALSTNSRVRATNARRLLGWQPNGPSLAHAVEQGL
jgi:nucleoside-diphosphate-sugar epimerase